MLQYVGAATTMVYGVSGSVIVSCVAGDTLAVYAASDTTVSLNATASNNTISIERLG